MSRAFATVLIIGWMGFALVAGCGDATRLTDPLPPAAPAAAPVAPVVGLEEEPVVPDNPRWTLLVPSFERFARRPVSAQKDIFRSKLDKYVERPEIKVEQEDPDAPPVELAEGSESLEPLKRFPADRFVPIMILTGTGVPKAMIRDPKGQTHIIGLDAEVGNENGVVTSITQHEIVIRHDDPKPVRLSLRPEVFDLAEKTTE